jgi:hypothetical protein
MGQGTMTGRWFRSWLRMLAVPRAVSVSLIEGRTTTPNRWKMRKWVDGFLVQNPDITLSGCAFEELQKNCMTKIRFSGALDRFTVGDGMPGGAKMAGGPLCRAAKPWIGTSGRRRSLQDASRSPVVVRLQDNHLLQPKTSATNDGESITSLHVGSQHSWTDEILYTSIPRFLDRPGTFGASRDSSFTTLI